MEMEPSPQRFSRRARAPNGRPQLNFAFCTSPGLHFFNRFLSQLENPGERISPWKNSWNLWNAYNFITKSLMSHSELLSLSCDNLCACCESCHAYVIWLPWFWSLAPLGCHRGKIEWNDNGWKAPWPSLFQALSIVILAEDLKVCKTDRFSTVKPWCFQWYMFWITVTRRSWNLFLGSDVPQGKHGISLWRSCCSTLSLEWSHEAKVKGRNKFNPDEIEIKLI